VTRRVCEKITQNVAQTIFGQNLCTTFTVEKVDINFWATCVCFQKTAPSNVLLKRRKFAQSGHPAQDLGLSTAL
jgi:hypothetical protein